MQFQPDGSFAALRFADSVRLAYRANGRDSSPANHIPDSFEKIENEKPGNVHGDRIRQITVAQLQRKNGKTVHDRHASP